MPAPTAFLVDAEPASEYVLRRPQITRIADRVQNPHSPTVHSVVDKSRPLTHTRHPRQRSFHPASTTSQSAGHLSLRRPPSHSSSITTTTNTTTTANTVNSAADPAPAPKPAPSHALIRDHLERLSLRASPAASPITHAMPRATNTAAVTDRRPRPALLNNTSFHPVADTIRRPILYQAKFGDPNQWALDIFTLPHNAIRAECVDLYNILESIHARSNTVDPLELEEFHTWWATFEIFLIEYFDFEADILFPWLFNPSPSTHAHARPPSGDHPFDLPPRKAVSQLAVMNESLLTRKDDLLDSVRQLNGTFELRHNVDIGDVFHTILDEINDFVPKLLEYFHVQERHLPTLVSRHYSSSAYQMMLKKYLHYIKKGESPQMNLVLLSRWMNTEMKEKWLRTNVGTITRILHRRWERRCDKSHGHVAYKFHKRLLSCVRSVAASRLRRRTDFGEKMDDISFGSLASHTGSIRSLNIAARAKSSPFAEDKEISARMPRARSRVL